MLILHAAATALLTLSIDAQLFQPGARPLRSLATGSSHSCAILWDGKITCWGENTYGQLGGAGPDRSLGDKTIDLPGGAIQVAAGSRHTCAIGGDGRVHCWGDNAQGQLGNHSTTPSASPVQISGDSLAVDLAAGLHHSCLLDATGAARCWGRNNEGQLGNGSNNYESTPREISNYRFVELAAGANHTCGRTARGDIYCWGQNSSGQIGDSTTIDRPRPARTIGTGFRSLTAGASHTCAISAEGGRPKCWGSNANGQLGTGDLNSRNQPTTIQTINFEVTSIGAGGAHTCVLKHGDLFCFGKNTRGQLGDGSTTQRTSAVAVGSSAEGLYLDVTGGANHSCATRANQEIACWGAGANGQIGSGVVLNNNPLPVKARLANHPRTVTATALTLTHATCTIARGAAVTPLCWGRGTQSFQLGDGTSADRSGPGPTLPARGPAWGLSAGGVHFPALISGGVIDSWGENSRGQLGDGSWIDRDRPVALSGLLRAIQVASNAESTCGRRADGSLTCWGANYSGELGIGMSGADVRNPSTPVIGVQDATQVSCAGVGACALVGDGRVKCWGAANAIGNNNGASATPVWTDPFSAPVKQLALGHLQGYALLEDGRLERYANQELCGADFQSASPMPFVEALDGTVVAAAAHSVHACAITDSGRVYCWGWGAPLGDGQPARDQTGPSCTEDPVLVAALKDVLAVSTGSSDTCAMKTDGSIWCWGANSFGQVGDGTAIERRVPTAVLGLP